MRGGRKRQLRRWLRLTLRAAWRSSAHLLFTVLVLVFVIWAALCLAAGSPEGTRWLLEKIVALQPLIRFQVEGGTLRDGLQLRNFTVTTKKFHIDADRVTLKLTWASLLRGELYVDSLRGENARLVFTGPPNPNPVKLKHLRLPFRLILADGALERVAVVKPTGTLAAARLSLQGADWFHEHLVVPNVELEHPRFHAKLSGSIDFSNQYPLNATGLLQTDFLSGHHLHALKARVQGDLSALQVNLVHRKPVPVEVVATLNVIQPLLDYRGLMRFGHMDVPWYPALELKTTRGLVHVRGDKRGLSLLGDADFSGKLFPQGNYRWYARTDWHSLQLLPLEARTRLGGVLNVSGDIGWQGQPHWNLASRWSGVDLSRQWPSLQPVLPSLSGHLLTQGRATAKGSSLGVQADWDSGEAWRATLQSQGWPWLWHQNQTLDFNWLNLARTVPGLGETVSTQGSLQWQGALNQYRFSTSLAMQSARTPAGDWEVTGQGGGKSFRADSFSYQGLAGSVTGEAAVAPGQPGWAWNARLALDNFRTDYWAPQWPAILSGPLQAEGSLAAGQQAVSLQRMALTGTLRDQPLAAQGDLALLLRPGVKYPDFKAHELQLDWGRDHLGVEGGVWASGWDMTLDAGLQELALLDTRVTGGISGVVQLQGPVRQPAVTLNLMGEKLGFAGISGESLSVSGFLPALAEQSGFLQLHGHQLAYGDRVIPDATLVVEGTKGAHAASWQIEADPVSAEGRLSGAFTVDGSGKPVWLGQSDDSSVAIHDFDWRQDPGAFAVQWTGADNQVAVGPHCWQADEARLCSREELLAGPEKAKAVLGLEGLEISRLAPLFPEGLAWNGSLEGDASLDWKKGGLPQLAMQLTTRQGSIGLAQEDDDPLSLPYDRLGLKVSTEDQRLRFRFETEAPHIGQGYIESWLDPSSKPYQVNGALVLEQVNLAVLKPFFPGMAHLSGELNLAGGLSGAITGPDFYGDFTLSGAEISARDAPLDLSRININAAIRGREAGINGTFMSGEGKASLQGKAEWKGEPSLALHLTGKDLALRQKPLISAQVDPDLNISVKPYLVDINGKVVVPEAMLKPQALSDKAIPLSPDVRVVDEARKARARVAKNMKQWAVNADIELLLRDKVQFEGFGLSSFMSGELRLQQQKQRGLQATGEIELKTTGNNTEARYEAYGQKLKIRKGQLLFAGPVTQPALNIEAVKEVADQVVGVRVEGRANAPTVQLFSDTPMTQDEMLGYLLIGRPLYQEGRLNVGGGNDTALLASAALSLGIRGGQGIASDIGSKVGLSDVALDAEGAGDETQFTVSGYLSPRLYLRYGVGVFTPVSKVTLRYKISHSLYLEAVSSLENALDLFYNIKY